MVNCSGRFGSECAKSPNGTPLAEPVVSGSLPEGGKWLNIQGPVVRVKLRRPAPSAEKATKRSHGAAGTFRMSPEAQPKIWLRCRALTGHLEGNAVDAKSPIESRRFRRLMPHNFWYLRPEGPAVARPGRQAGIKLERNRAPKVRHLQRAHSAAPSALIFMLTIYPGLTAGATLCRRFAPGDVICSVWGEIRTNGSSDVEPRRGDRK
jgi:hypothetical protein